VIIDGQLDLEVFCNTDLTATFVISNVSGTVSDGTYRLSDPAKTGSIGLAPGEDMSINGAGDATMKVTYKTSLLSSVSLSVNGSCIKHPDTPTPLPTVTNTPEPTSTSTPMPTATDVWDKSSISVKAKCDKSTGKVVFTITNGGSAMTGPTTWSASAPGISLSPSSGSISLGAGESTAIKFGPYWDVKISIVVQQRPGHPGTGSAKADSTCYSPTATPLPTITNTPLPTATNTPIPTATNTPLPTATNTPVPTATNTPVPTATNTPLPTATNTPIPTATNTPLPTATNTPQPDLSAHGTCSADAEASFTVTNSGGTMGASERYTVKDASGGIVESGTIKLDSGESTTIKVTGVYGKLTLSISGLGVSADTNCAAPTSTPAPSLSASGTCSVDGIASFTVTNSGGPMGVGAGYTVKDAGGATVKSGTITLDSGGSATIKVTGVYGKLTLSIPGFGVSADTVCAAPTSTPAPSLSASGTCSVDGIASFTVTNSGGPMGVGANYTVKDAGGATVESGTIKLDSGGSTTIKVTGVYGKLTLSIPGFGVSADTVCAAPTSTPAPSLSASGTCSADGVASFTVTNGGGPMGVGAGYTVKDAGGATVESGTIKLDSGGSTTIKVTGVYGKLTLSIPGFGVSADTVCAAPTSTPAPSLSASGTCSANGIASFTVTNGGGPMGVSTGYTVKGSSGATVDSGAIKLGGGESTTIKVTGVYGKLTLSLPGFGVTVDTVCAAPTSTPGSPTSTPTSPGGVGVGGVFVHRRLPNSLHPLSEVPAVSPKMPSFCIQCLVFHTFRDGNLEIYRLDGIEGQEGFKLVDLTRNQAVDSRPSRSPNDSWVVFQSNRDGNVELYYTDLGGGLNPIRLTYTQSNNTNPMYGPDSRTIVYQSDRNGNGDLFLINQRNKEELQITSSPAEDINPYYSPDLDWVVFQSNRNNNWDLFIVNTTTGNEYQLTNSAANEIFPAWSPNGKQVAFLSDEGGGTDLFIVDYNGKNLKRITTDGKTNNIAWSPEGNRIAYQSERNGNLDIYTYDLTTGKEYRVTTNPGPDSGPTWDCGGANLAFTATTDGDPNIFQVYWQGGAVGNMTIDPATDKWSQWRPSNDVSSTGY
jgi:beta propeller repeat protein